MKETLIIQLKLGTHAYIISHALKVVAFVRESVEISHHRMHIQYGTALNNGTLTIWVLSHTPER